MHSTTREVFVATFQPLKGGPVSGQERLGGDCRQLVVSYTSCGEREEEGR